MIVKIAVSPMDRMPNADWETPRERPTYDSKDAKAFLEATGDADMKGLMAQYASPCASLFGFADDLYHEDEWEESPESKDTVDSYANLATLVQSFASLFDAKRRLDDRCGKAGALSCLDELDAPGLEVEWLSRDGKSGLAEVSAYIPLRPDECTSAFLEEGVRNSPSCDLTSYNCTTRDPDYRPILSLRVRSRPMRVDDFTLSRPVDDLINRFAKLMLHDVDLEVEGDEIYLQAGSVASSIWCAVLDASCEGHVKRCAFCGRLIVALDERRPRRFCGNNCNKNYQRATKFKRLVEGGTPEAQAAKIAGMSLDRCRTFWKAP